MRTRRVKKRFLNPAGSHLAGFVFSAIDRVSHGFARIVWFWQSFCEPV
jgi:hypothetical protein